jgi:hypothetical protein
VDRVELSRHARAGIAFVGGAKGPFAASAFDLDADLTEVESDTGQRVRQVAAGGEVWLVRRWLGLRGGVTRDRSVVSRSTYSGGASLRVAPHSHLDASVRVGDAIKKDWSVSFRVTF